MISSRLATLLSLVVVTVTLIVITSNDWRAETDSADAVRHDRGDRVRAGNRAAAVGGRDAGERRGAGARPGRRRRDAGRDRRGDSAAGPRAQPQQAAVGRLLSRPAWPRSRRSASARSKATAHGHAEDGARIWRCGP